MKGGRMTPMRENSGIPEERDSVDTIIVEIRVGDARDPGATRR